MSAVTTVKQVAAAAPGVDGDALLGALATLEQGSPDGCVVLRAERNGAGAIEDFSFRFANPSAERLLGREGEPLLGQRLVEVLPVLHRGGRIPQGAQVVETGQPLVWEGPYRDSWFRIMVTRFLDGVLVRFQDITSSKRGEWERDALLVREHSGRMEAEALARQQAGELLEARERLAQSERLAVAGQLAAGVGHEINNPLAFVTGNLHVALEQLGTLARELGPGAERLQETVHALEDAHRGAERIRGIVKDLRTLARADETHQGPVDVHAALDFSVTLAMPHLRHRARLERRYGRLPAARGNEAKLGQVFLNLLLNAAQAIPEGEAERHCITLMTRYEEGRVVVEVADTGRGMAPEVLARIFEPFFTTKPVGEGMGLGLAICLGIIRGMGGELTAESEPGRGSTFRVVLPADEAQARRGAPLVGPVVEASERKRVLVIDDEPAIGSVMRRLLGRKHDVVVVQSGREALVLLEADDGFDVVFCDLMMSDVTGMELHARLAELHPECLARFVFMTGGGFTERAQEFLRKVPLPRLDKPFEPETIRELVARAPPRRDT